MVVFVGEPEAVHKRAAKLFQGLDWEDDTGCGYATGCRTATGGFVYIIRVSTNKDTAYFMSTIAHESLHISWHLLDNLGVDLDCDNHEAQAYLMDHLVKKICEGYFKGTRRKAC